MLDFPSTEISHTIHFSYDDDDDDDDNKYKTINLQAWTGPEGSMRLRLPGFKTFGTWWW